MRAADKIIEGLTQLLEGFTELQSKVEEEFDSEQQTGDGDAEDPDLRLEIDAALVTEMRATLEAVMDAEDYSSDEIASLISVAQDALEEIDPDVFEEVEEEEEEEGEEDETYYEDDDDDDYGYDDGLDDDDDLDEDDEEFEEEEDDDEDY